MLQGYRQYSRHKTRKRAPEGARFIDMGPGFRRDDAQVGWRRPLRQLIKP
jgi:hypothetical protein